MLRLMKLVAICTLAFCASARGQAEQAVVFQISQATTPGQSVFVMGDAAELGANDLRRSVKLDPAAYPTWRITVSIPANTTYTFRYYLRDDGPGRTSDATNGTAVSMAVTASTGPAPVVPLTRTVLWNSTQPTAVLWWRRGGAGAFAPSPMQRFSPGRATVLGEVRWASWNAAPASGSFEFYLTNAAGTARVPASGSFSTRLDGVLVQDGQVFSYVPAPTVAAARRDYAPSSPPAIASTNLGENRRYRVFLPRGYAEHPARRYPVVYMHDGQNVFESGPFGSWNAAPTLDGLGRSGGMREVIVVGVDNGPNRLRDYLPPGDSLGGNGRADVYAAFLTNELKPLIDASYRTLTGPETTGSIGSSMGGVVSLYLGWDHTSVFRRVGPMSGAWQTCPNFLNRVRPAGSMRAITIAMDSGDSGSANDNYWLTYGLRDALAGGALSRFPIEGSLRHTVGFGQQHNEAAWAARLPGVLAFLYPADDEANDIVRSVLGAQLDVTADGRIDIDDLVEQTRSPRDLDLGGAAAEGDTVFLTRALRADERAGLIAGR